MLGEHAKCIEFIITGQPLRDAEDHCRSVVHAGVEGAAGCDDAIEVRHPQAIRRTLLETPGVAGVHDVRTRKMGDMIVVDAHLEVDGSLTVEAGHDIAVEARNRILQRHRVLHLMTHLDPWKRPDLDHAPPH